MADRLLTFADLQEVLSLSRRTCIRLRDNGTLPAVKIGRAVRFRLSDVERYLESGCVPLYRTQAPGRRARA